MKIVDIIQLYLKLFQMYMEEIFLCPQSQISDEITFLVNILKKKVLKFNETNLNNQELVEVLEVFDFIQPLANLYNKMILVIDYSNKLM
jgi:hypothetical protein